MDSEVTYGWIGGLEGRAEERWPLRPVAPMVGGRMRENPPLFVSFKLLNLNFLGAVPRERKMDVLPLRLPFSNFSEHLDFTVIISGNPHNGLWGIPLKSASMQGSPISTKLTEQDLPMRAHLLRKFGADRSTLILQ